MLKYSKHGHWLCFLLSCSLSLSFFLSLAIFTVQQPFLSTLWALYRLAQSEFQNKSSSRGLCVWEEGEEMMLGAVLK